MAFVGLKLTSVTPIVNVDGAGGCKDSETMLSPGDSTTAAGAGAAVLGGGLSTITTV